MILDERLESDKIEKRKIILANARELAKELTEMCRDGRCKEVADGYYSMTVDTGDGEETYYVYSSHNVDSKKDGYYAEISTTLPDYFYNDKSIEQNGLQIQPKRISGSSRICVWSGLEKNGDRVFFESSDYSRIKLGKCSGLVRYELKEDGERLGRHATDDIDTYGKIEGDTFFERFLSIEDEFLSRVEPEDLETTRSHINALKGMMQPFVSIDLHHETEEAKYRREIKEKIEQLEQERDEERARAEKSEAENEKSKSESAMKEKMLEDRAKSAEVEVEFLKRQMQNMAEQMKEKEKALADSQVELSKTRRERDGYKNKATMLEKAVGIMSNVVMKVSEKFKIGGKRIRQELQEEIKSQFNSQGINFGEGDPFSKD